MARKISTGEAAAELDVSRGTLLRWARDGIVTPASKTAGGHRRWDLDDLRRQLGEHEHEHQADKPAAADSDSHADQLTAKFRAAQAAADRSRKPS